MNIAQLKEAVVSGAYDSAFISLYGDNANIDKVKTRYLDAIDNFSALYGSEISEDRDVGLFSVPGRSEISGNHTDHNHGKVLAASISLDIIAVAAKTDKNIIRVKSEGFDEDTVSLEDVKTVVPEEKYKASAIIRGMCDGFLSRGRKIGGFAAYTTSNVLKGSGLSSSAAFEVMIGNILNHLYNDGEENAVSVLARGYGIDRHFKLRQADRDVGHDLLSVFCINIQNRLEIPVELLIGLLGPRGDYPAVLVLGLLKPGHGVGAVVLMDGDAEALGYKAYYIIAGQRVAAFCKFDLAAVQSVKNDRFGAIIRFALGPGLPLLDARGGRSFARTYDPDEFIAQLSAYFGNGQAAVSDIVVKILDVKRHTRSDVRDDLFLLRLRIVPAETAQLALYLGLAHLDILGAHLALEELTYLVARLARTDNLQPVAAWAF